MIPAIPFLGLAITAAVTYIAKQGIDIAKNYYSRTDRAAEREHELKMTELKAKLDTDAVVKEAFGALNALKSARAAFAAEEAKLQAAAKPGSTPRTFKSN